MSEWPFKDLKPFSFGMIMADNPWSFDNWSEAGEEKNAKSHYECVPTEKLAALPVGHLARRDCWLFQWATHPMLKDAIEVTEAWGFKVVTSGVWVKRGESGKIAFGPGYVLRCSSEPFIIAKMGNPPTFSKSIRTVIEAPRRRHSEKPLEAYRMCERLFGDVPRLSLFDRKTLPGWTMFGDQVGLLDSDPPVSTRQIRAQQKRKAAEQQQAIEPTPLLNWVAA